MTNNETVTTRVFCEAAAEWDHDWENDKCRECGEGPGLPEPLTQDQ